MIYCYEILSLQRNNIILMKNTFLFAAFILFCLPAFSQIPTSGLMAYYPFCGSANDVSGNGHTLKLSGGASLCPDRNGNANSAYHFNWIDGILYNDTMLSITGDFTYSVWMSADTIEDGIVLYNGSAAVNGIGISFHDGTGSPGSKITLQVGGIGYPVVITSSRHQWHHIVLRSSSGNYKVTIDTVLVGTSTIVPNPPAGGKFEIGKDFVNGKPFYGEIDDVSIYNRALTDAEVKGLFLGCGYEVTTQPSPATANKGNNATFSVITAMSSPSFQWQQDAGTGFLNLSNSGPYSGVNTNSLLITGVTTSMNNYHYRCVINNNFCCTDTTQSAKLTVTTTSVNNIFNENDINIYPNPANGVFTIAIKNLKNISGCKIIINNIVGQGIYETSIINENTEVKIDGKGIFMLRLLDQQNRTIAIKKISIN